MNPSRSSRYGIKKLSITFFHYAFVLLSRHGRSARWPCKYFCSVARPHILPRLPKKKKHVRSNFRHIVDAVFNVCSKMVNVVVCVSHIFHICNRCFQNIELLRNVNNLGIRICCLELLYGAFTLKFGGGNGRNINCPFFGWCFTIFLVGARVYVVFLQRVRDQRNPLIFLYVSGWQERYGVPAASLWRAPGGHRIHFFPCNQLDRTGSLWSGGKTHVVTRNKHSSKMLFKHKTHQLTV